MLMTLQPRGLTQREAAAYIGVAVSTFRKEVHVEAKSVAKSVPGKKPILRYFIEDLDQWMDECAAVKSADAESKESTV